MTSSGHERGLRRREALRRWFRDNRRDFWWRRTGDPWRTLVAETLLRRTRAAQVERRVAEVIAHYATPLAMASAPPEEVREILQPLGLQWRADNLAAASRMIVHDFGGRTPTTMRELISLPGVGPYVAAATAASTTGALVELIDTNTVRVSLRVAGIARHGDPRRRAETIAAVDALLGGPAGGADWWAVIDLAATICKPRGPSCSDCPIKVDCTTGRAASSKSGDAA